MYFVVTDKYLKKKWSLPSEKEFENKEDALKYIENKLKDDPSLECLLLNKEKYIINFFYNQEYWKRFFENYIKRYYVLFVETNTGIVLDTKKNRFINENEYDYLTFNSLEEAISFCKEEVKYFSDISYIVSHLKPNEGGESYEIFYYYSTIEEVERKRKQALKIKQKNSIFNKIKKLFNKN